MYSTKTNDMVRSLPFPSRNANEMNLPCTAIAFRPDNAALYKNKNVLTAGYANGKLVHWHYTSGQKLAEIDEGENEQINCVQYFRDGSRFATAGSDVWVRVYDAATQKVINKMQTGQGELTAGHSNRIFSVKFHPKDPNILITGGWDNTIQ
ncbi:hypothetical protein HK102_010163, partial [Quaeritorhiza haematococci]